MIPYELPYNISRFDVYGGTIISSNRSGVEIRLDCGQEAENQDLRAFAFSGGHIGQRVLVSVKKYIAERNNFLVSVDSFYCLNSVSVLKPQFISDAKLSPIM